MKLDMNTLHLLYISGVLIVWICFIFVFRKKDTNSTDF